MMEDISNLFCIIEQLEQQAKSYIRDLRIADIINRIETLLNV
ncbi:hypothetical protein [Clostridium swellfunianum]|nr:hypothetical protein [Clostridium swellfunianum]